MPEMRTDIMVWGDLETTGLDAISNHILEVGFWVTNLDGKKLGGHHSLVLPMKVDDVFELAAPIVKEMHTESGLWADLREVESYATAAGLLGQYRLSHVESQIIGWLQNEMGIDRGTVPLAGSSISFDRSFLAEHMPMLNNFLHYRNIDISSLKELCRRYNPRVYEKRPDARGNHRASSDIEASIAEFLFYRDNFLHVTV